MGDLTGHVDDTTQPDGTRIYAITFEKSGWTYYVSAKLGMIGDQDNKVTPEELNAIALSMAEQ